MDGDALGDVPLGKNRVEVVITAVAPDEEIPWPVEGPAGPHWSTVDESWRKRVRFPAVSEASLKAALGILERTVRRRGQPVRRQVIQ
ncbi:hypothetical protein [Amycolatopsis australiensis]|uniref:hypothetical protein n=1 Tax=Amycolatopsis australiensis TaxID=546364 RepID=UPI0009303F7C|nr:hypothetical protein [Amycolatopsis australiensis]